MQIPELALIKPIAYGNSFAPCKQSSGAGLRFGMIERGVTFKFVPLRVIATHRRLGRNR